MRTIVLCVDRDDDIGQKTGKKGPIIGREKNLEVANQLALADPEDSDINTVFNAVKLAKDMDAEVATITGHPSVGMESDKHITKQLDQILEGFDEAVVVTDGAEDEFVLPLIESRIKVRSLNRVIINQSQNLETTYYIFKRIMDDPRILKKFFIPLGLAFLGYAALSITGLQMYAVSGIVGVLGIYLVNKAARFDKKIHRSYKSIKYSFLSGKISFIGYVTGILLSIVGGIRGYYTATEITAVTSLYMGEEVLFWLSGFLSASIWWWITGILIMSTCILTDRYLDKGKIDERIIVISFFSGSAAILLWGGSQYILNPFFGGEQKLFLSIISSLILGLVGIGASKSLKKAGWTTASTTSTTSRDGEDIA